MDTEQRSKVMQWFIDAPLEAIQDVLDGNEIGDMLESLPSKTIDASPKLTTLASIANDAYMALPKYTKPTFTMEDAPMARRFHSPEAMDNPANPETFKNLKLWIGKLQRQVDSIESDILALMESNADGLAKDVSEYLATSDSADDDGIDESDTQGTTKTPNARETSDYLRRRIFNQQLATLNGLRRDCYKWIGLLYDVLGKRDKVDFLEYVLKPVLGYDGIALVPTNLFTHTVKRTLNYKSKTVWADNTLPLWHKEKIRHTKIVNNTHEEHWYVWETVPSVPYMQRYPDHEEHFDGLTEWHNPITRYGKDTWESEQAYLSSYENWLNVLDGTVDNMYPNGIADRLLFEYWEHRIEHSINPQYIEWQPNTIRENQDGIYDGSLHNPFGDAVDKLAFLAELEYQRLKVMRNGYRLHPETAPDAYKRYYKQWADFKRNRETPKNTITLPPLVDEKPEVLTMVDYGKSIKEIVKAMSEALKAARLTDGNIADRLRKILGYGLVQSDQNGKIARVSSEWLGLHNNLTFNAADSIKASGNGVTEPTTIPRTMVPTVIGWILTDYARSKGYTSYEVMANHNAKSAMVRQQQSDGTYRYGLGEFNPTFGTWLRGKTEVFSTDTNELLQLRFYLETQEGFRSTRVVEFTGREKMRSYEVPDWEVFQRREVMKVKPRIVSLGTPVYKYIKI